jgi:MFS family permease
MAEVRRPGRCGNRTELVVAVSRPRAPSWLRRARLGVFSSFFLAGFLAAVWVVNIPAIQERTHISKAVLGLDLLVFGLGSVVSMQVGGFLIDKIGSRYTVLAGSIVLILAINLPGFATNSVLLGIALFIFGLGNGSVDLAMNDQAVLVERGHKRPIMSAFHAFYSVGSAVGAVFGALTQALGLDLNASFLMASIIAAALAAFSVPRLLRRSAAPAVSPVMLPSAGPAPAPAGLARGIAVLAILAFLLMLSEGVANDWSPLQAVQRLHQSHAAASLAFGTFAISMTIGRFSADRISHLFGPVRIVRYGSVVAAAGMLIVILSSAYPVTLAGWALFGIGISGVAPQIFSAAGNLSSASRGVVLSRVVSAGYAGQLVGPAIIGWIASGIGLSLAFTLPLVLLASGIVFAGVVGPRAAGQPQAAQSGLTHLG